LESYLRLNPSLAILAGLLSGILPFAMDPGTGVMAAMVFPLVLFAFSCAFSSWRNTIKIGISSAAGLILAISARNPSESHYDSILPQRNCGAIIEAEVDDTTCSSSEESSWMSQPYLMRIKLRKFKYSRTDTWKTAEGSSAVILPKECPRLGYGDTVIMEGAFILPDPPLFKGDFDFRRYLLANGIRRIFDAGSCEVESRPGKLNFYRNVMVFRDFLMNKSVEGMKDVENKKIGAAINFGCRQGLSAEDRKNFLRSGTIHIFSISGMNVAIIAIFLFWALRGIPFTARHLVVPAIIFLYVFTTGMPPPAVRAFLMISVWCIQRAFLYPSSSINSVFFAAALILVFNPYAVLDVGFQFSFIVAGFLVLSWNSSEKWVASAMEPSRWVPVQGGWTIHLLRAKFTRNVFRALMTSLIAWLAGMGLCLAYQGIFVPSSIITNFAIVPFVSVFFMAVVAKIALFPLAPAANFAGSIGEWSLDVIRSASEFGASFGNEYLLKPPLWMIAIFYVAVVVLAVSERRKAFFAAAAVIVAMTSCWYWNNSFSDGSIYVLSGGESQEPVIAVCQPGKRDAFIINAGSRQTTRPLLNIFAKRGINCVDTLLICESRKDFCAGSKYILAGSSVSCLVIPEKYKQSWFSKKTVENAWGSGTWIRFIPEGFSNVMKNGNVSFSSREYEKDVKEYLIRIFLPETIMEIKIRDGGKGVRRLEIGATGSNNISMELVNANIPVIKELKF